MRTVATPANPTPLFLSRLSDAISWIQSRALVGPTDSSGSWGRVTQMGRELAAEGEALTQLFAADRLSGKLDKALESKVRLAFSSGDYETASFTAMKEVEVTARTAGAGSTTPWSASR